MKKYILATLAIVVICGGLWAVLHQNTRKNAVESQRNRENEVSSATTGASTNPTTVNSGSVPSQKSREFDSNVNPYAGALKEPGKSRRAWDANFIKQFQNGQSGDPIRFELSDGRVAVGTIRVVQKRDGEISYVGGELTEPETGRFFFSTPPAEGKAGKAVGVIEFPASQTAYRIEPTGPDGDPELWQRRMDEVVCMSMPLATDPPTSNETSEIPPLRPGGMPDYIPSYNSNIVSLQSFPGSRAVLLLDFFGGYTPTWGGAAYPRPNVGNDQIKDLWKRVAEDFMGFNINVTTDIQVYQNAPATSRQRCVFTPSTSVMPSGAAGVAYIGSWNWGNDTVCWSIYYTGKNGSEVGAHEPGHTLGLGHQGTPTSGYSSGQGSGVTGWCPIMGVGYYQPVTTWAKGEYQGANNTEDELVKITTQNNNVTYRPDDTGATLATSRYLEIYPDFAAFGEGVIERTGDTDAFQFTTSGGEVALTARPVGSWADLAVSVTLADATDTIINSNNPQSVLSATISTNLPAGTYTFRVSGIGRNNALTNGFSSYASLGYYSIAGSVAGGRLPNRLSIMEKSPNGTAVGTVPAVNPADTHVYSIASGNSNNTFSIDAASGSISVANNTLLDYVRWSTNNMLAVQFELMVNITDVTTPSLTELNRRVLISVLGTNLNYPIAASGYNAAIIVPYNATTASPGAQAFDAPNNFAFYQAGLNHNSQVGGSGGGQGLPGSGSFLSQVDGSTFQSGPYGGTNALLLGRIYPSVNTLTFATPQSYNTIAILAASANGGGLGKAVLNFTNGSSVAFDLNAQDWYNTVTSVAIQGIGRLKLGQATLQTEDSGWNNPNLYQTTINLASLGLNIPVASITFTNPPIGGNQNVAVFAVSGSVMSPRVVIARQPQSVTNSNPSVPSMLLVGAMGAAPLSYQWYGGNPGSATLLGGQTSASLVFNPTTTNDQGNYFVVVSNSLNFVTSSVATLTVFTAPVITQQLSPATSIIYEGQPVTFSISANAASPLTYYWRYNGNVFATGAVSTYTIASAQVTNSGSYSVILSNAFGSVTSSIASLTVFPTPTFANVTNGLVVHLAFEGTYTDSSGRGHHGTPRGIGGGLPSFVPGKIGDNALHYFTVVPGSTVTSSGFATIGTPGSPVADFQFGAAQNFSVSYWVKLPAGSLTGDLPFLCSAQNSYLNFGVSLAPSYQKGGWSWYLGNSSSGVGLYGPDNSINNGAWHHLLHTFNRSGSAITYLDGIQVNSTSITAAGNIDSGLDFNVGSDGLGTYPEAGSADIDDIGVWRRVLSPVEAQAIYTVGQNAGRSFDTYGPVTLQINNSGNSLQFIWEAGTLLEAPAVDGPWTTVPGAAAPYFTVPAPTSGNKFYKVRL